MISATGDFYNGWASFTASGDNRRGPTASTLPDQPHQWPDWVLQKSGLTAPTHFLLSSRKDLAEQTTPGSQGADSSQLHTGAAHLLALGHSTGSLCEGANWNYSTAPRLLGGTARSAHQICQAKSALKPSFRVALEFLNTSVISYPCSAAEVRRANTGVEALAGGAAFQAAGIMFILPAKSEVKNKFYPGDKLCIT